MKTRNQAALEVVKDKVKDFEDFLQGYKDQDQSVNVIDPFCSNEKIGGFVKEVQNFYFWVCDELRKEKEVREIFEAQSDEIFEKEVITTLDDELKDRGLRRGMF